MSEQGCLLRDVVPCDLFVQILMFMSITDLARVAAVAKWWQQMIFGHSNQECWYYTTKKWKYGWHVDDAVFSPRAYRNQAISRHRMDHLVVQFFYGRRQLDKEDTMQWMFMTSTDERSLDCLFGCLKRELSQTIIPRKTICLPSALSYLCERMMVSNQFRLSLFDMELNGAESDELGPDPIDRFPASPHLLLPAVFTGTFTQVFELEPGSFGHFFTEPNYCRSEWSFTLILEPLSNTFTQHNSAWPLVSSPVNRSTLATKCRQSVKAFCCWRKESQLSSPSLSELSQLPMGYPMVNWVLGLHAGVGKSVISISEGFYQPENGLLYLSATGDVLVKPEHHYPNAPGRSGTMALFLDKDHHCANGLFAVDLANAYQGPGFFFLDRVTPDEWLSSSLCCDMPRLGLDGIGFTHATTMLLSANS